MTNSGMTSGAGRVRLTQYARGGGCACKIPPGELEAAVASLIPDAPADDLLIEPANAAGRLVELICVTLPNGQVTTWRRGVSRRPFRR